jgi:cysteine sulfinate desulfinase/cysteine desulfurase-like protein
MARKLRIEFPDAVYHVLNRGNYRRDLFTSSGEAGAFVSALEEATEIYGWQVHAYAVMRNHYHVALRTPQPNLIEGMHWFGPEPGEQRMPQHLSLAFDRVEGEALMLNLDVAGVAVTAGAGCLPANEKMSPVLKALGVDPRLALGMILLGPGPETTDEQIGEAVRRVVKGVERIREMTP